MISLGGIGITLQAHTGHLSHCVVTLLQNLCCKLSTEEREVTGSLFPAGCWHSSPPVLVQLQPSLPAEMPQGTLAWLCLCFYRGLC